MKKTMKKTMNKNVNKNVMKTVKKTAGNIYEPENDKAVTLKPGLRYKLTKILELPGEVVQNVPRITVVGAGSMVVENYKGIVEYDPVRIKLNTGSGILKITGAGLSIREITSEDILVEGRIGGLEFL